MTPPTMHWTSDIKQVTKPAIRAAENTSTKTFNNTPNINKLG